MITWDEVAKLKPTQYLYEPIIPEPPGSMWISTLKPDARPTYVVIAAGENGVMLNPLSGPTNVIVFFRRDHDDERFGTKPVGGIDFLYLTHDDATAAAAAASVNQ